MTAPVNKIAPESTYLLMAHQPTLALVQPRRYEAPWMKKRGGLLKAVGLQWKRPHSRLASWPHRGASCLFRKGQPSPASPVRRVAPTGDQGHSG